MTHPRARSALALVCLSGIACSGPAPASDAPSALDASAESGRVDGGDHDASRDAAIAAPDASAPITCPEAAEIPLPVGPGNLDARAGVAWSWSHHHYVHLVVGSSATVIASELWYPWILGGPSTFYMATSTPWRTFRGERTLGSEPIGPSTLRPLAGDADDGVLFDDTRTLYRVLAGGLPFPVATLPAQPMERHAEWEEDVAPRIAALAGGTVFWADESSRLWSTVLDGGSSVFLTFATDLRALVASDALVAWLDGSTVFGRALGRSIEVLATEITSSTPSLAVRGASVFVPTEIEVRALRPGAEPDVVFRAAEGRRIHAIASDDCALYVLSTDGAAWVTIQPHS